MAQQPNLRLILNNLHDTTLLTATSNALPIAYTQRSERARPWRSTDTAEQILEATLPTPTFLEGVVLYRHNLSSAARVRLELLNGTTVAYDSGAVTTSGIIPLGEFRFGIDEWGATSTDDLPIKQSPFWFNSTLCTGYRLTLTDPDNPAGYLEVGRIVAGAVISPTFNVSFGIKPEWQDFGEHKRTEGLSLRTIGDGEARRLPINLDHLDAADRAKFSSAFLRSGKRNDIYVSVMPEKGGMDEAEYAFLARREGNYSHTHNRPRNWQTQITFIEV